MKIELPQLAWQGSERLHLDFPEGWNIEVCNMAGYDRPPMEPAAIGNAIAEPLGLLPIRELARDRSEVVIIFDDMSRITRVAGIVPWILDELTAGGIPDENIRFVAALGCHGAMNRLDFVRKLGEETLNRFPVYNHNAFGNCVEIGTTSYGTRVFVNAEVMKCDLKIGIGSIVPHIMAGFGGGTKILMPGVCSIETIESLHRLQAKAERENPGRVITGMGVYENNPLRLNMEEAAEMAGLDMIVNCIVNMWGETAALFVGEPKQAYRAGIDLARDHYLTPRVDGKDIVIANTFAKVNESESGLITTMSGIKPEGGDIVLICQAPEGHAVHYLMGPFGKFTGGNLQLQIKPPENINRLIILNKYTDMTSLGYFKDTDRIQQVCEWEEALELLYQRHGERAEVAVYPNSEVQYCLS